MRASLTSAFFLSVLLSLAANNPWPLLFLVAALSSNWLGPGGSAWRLARARTQATSPTPPGPSGWPLLGSIPSMGPLAHRKLSSMSRSHSATRLMSLSLGSTPVVISSDPETAREILFGPAFSDRPVKTSARLLMFERAIGFAPSGDHWRHLRRIASSSMFSPRRVAALESVRRGAAEGMLARAEVMMSRSGVVALRDVLQWGSLESVVRSVVGKVVREGDAEALAGMVREGYELIGRFNWEDHFPALGSLLDCYGVGRRCEKLASRVRVLMGGIIEDRRSGGEIIFHDKVDDFLGLLLSLPEGERLCDADTIAVIWEMIFRGADVVAILLEWAMARIILHPEIQAKAQQEIDEIAMDRPVNDSDIPMLHYLQAIVKEVLRMHPPGPLLSWARLAIKDVHVNNHFVPAGTSAIVNMWAITHDPKVWKDPWAFRPERFLEEDVNIMGSDLRLAPFGAGRRVCPGRTLGLATVHIWLARFLQEYKWTAARPVQLSECLRLSLEMKKPLMARAILRQAPMKL